MASETDGFVRVPNWLLDDSDLTLHEMVVYVVLLRFRDHKTGMCFPGISTIADRARLSRKTVERTVRALEGRGLIHVTRRSTLRENKPNQYEVALATEAPPHIWESTSRGKRIPKRDRPTDSESVGNEPGPTDSESVVPSPNFEPTDSESLPTDSESVPPQTPSRPNKNHKNKNHEQAIRSTQERRRDEFFSFEETEKITAKQLGYLHDLHIHLTGSIPNARSKTKWEGFTVSEAQQLIGSYLRQIPRYDAYGGPEHGTPAYNALSPTGRQWADRGFIPDLLEVA